MVSASWLRDTLGVRRAAFADTFKAAEVMAMRPEDGNARQVRQAFADGATMDELEKHIAFLRSPGAPGDAQPAREDDTRTVRLGAAKLQVPPMAWQTRTGGGHAL